MNICNNSIRLLINYLEKFSLLDEPITLNIAKKICTNISYYDFERYTNAWYVKKSLPEAITIIYNIFDKGYSVMDILDSYFQFIKICNISRKTINTKLYTIFANIYPIFTLYMNMKLNWFFLQTS